MSKTREVLIIEENSFIPADPRVWYEATALRDAGFNVSVICPFKKEIDTDTNAAGSNVVVENLDDVTVYRFPLHFASFGIMNYIKEYFTAFVYISRLSWLIWRKCHFDLLHLCNPPDIFFPLAIFYRLLGVRIIFDHHDLVPEMILWRYRGLVGRFLYFFARIMELLTIRVAHIVISTNQSYRRLVMERGRLSGKRVIVVRNGPKIDEFVPHKADLSLKCGVPYLVCYAGVMGSEDGILELILSIRYIVHEIGRSDILFVLLGDGSVYKQAISNVKAWGLEEFVYMPGMILDRSLLYRYLSTADVCTSSEPLTPLNNLSTFIKVGEYMAVGKPIVAFDLVETRYTAQDAAIYVEPGNTQKFGQALVTLIENPDLRQKMGEFGRKRVMNYLCWEHQKPYLLKAYAAALSKKG